MSVKMRRLLAVLCGVIMVCNSGMGIVAHAQEDVAELIISEYRELTGDNIGHGLYDISGNGNERAATLRGCSLGISIDANGVYGSITTGSTVTASKIGVKNIKVEKYVNGKWTEVGSSNGGYETNDDYHALNVSVSPIQQHVYYRISCTHYAVLNGVTHELNNVTDGVKYP